MDPLVLIYGHLILMYIKLIMFKNFEIYILYALELCKNMFLSKIYAHFHFFISFINLNLNSN